MVVRKLQKENQIPIYWVHLTFTQWFCLSVLAIHQFSSADRHFCFVLVPECFGVKTDFFIFYYRGVLRLKIWILKILVVMLL